MASLGATVAALSTGFVVVAAQAGSSSTPPNPEIYAANPSPVAPVSSLDPALQGRLSSFNRPQNSNDVAPSDIVPSDMKARGANTQIGRLAGTFGGQSVYLVPAQGGLCLVSTTLTATGCFSSSDVLADKVTALVECYPYMPWDQQEIFGMLPGASGVVASFSDGSQQPVTLQGDVFVLDAKPDQGSYPTRLSWHDGSGNESLPTGMGPPAVPHPCTAHGVSPNGATPAQAIVAARARIASGQG